MERHWVFRWVYTKCYLILIYTLIVMVSVFYFILCVYCDKNQRVQTWLTLSLDIPLVIMLLDTSCDKN